MKNKTITEMLLNGVGTVAYMSGWLVWKLKKQIWFVVLIAIAMYLPLTVMPSTVFAPKAEATLDGTQIFKPTTEQQQIKAYIKEVFGQYSDQAIAVASCESHLNPKAKNDNTTWGGVGRDWSVFQINDTYQGVTNKAFLTDWHVNVNMAWVIFKNAGYNWHLWTCGRNLGL